MNLISDTNIWIDFETISVLELPLRLNYKIHLCAETIKDELLVPSGILNRLVELGLIPLFPEAEEYYTARKIRDLHPKLSRHDDSSFNSYSSELSSSHRGQAPP
jgi:hypothetical protein